MKTLSFILIFIFSLSSLAEVDLKKANLYQSTNKSSHMGLEERLNKKCPKGYNLKFISIRGKVSTYRCINYSSSEILKNYEWKILNSNSKKLLISSKVPKTGKVEYTYDRNRRLMTSQSSLVKCSFKYDKSGKLLPSEGVQKGCIEFEKKIDFSLNASLDEYRALIKAKIQINKRIKALSASGNIDIKKRIQELSVRDETTDLYRCQAKLDEANLVLSKYLTNRSDAPRGLIREVMSIIDSPKRDKVQVIAK